MLKFTKQNCLGLVIGLVSLTSLAACGKKSTVAACKTIAPTCSSNMYAKYKDAGFNAVNASIVANVAAEIKANGSTNLGSSFQNHLLNPATADETLDTFTSHLDQFLKETYGAIPNKLINVERNMKAAHAGMKITAAQYDYFVSSIVTPALRINITGTNVGDITDCFAPVLLDACFKSNIVGQ